MGKSRKRKHVLVFMRVLVCTCVCIVACIVACVRERMCVFKMGYTDGD